MSGGHRTGRSGIAGLSALVTGGGSGIGLGAATRLVRDGAHVTICGRTEERLRSAVALLEEAARASAAAGGPAGTAAYVVADVTVEEQVAEAVAAASAERGRLDILFANAGGAMHMGPIADADLDQVRATVDLNLIGTFLCIKHGAPLMAAGVGTGVDGARRRGLDHRHVVGRRRASPTATCGPTARPRPASTCCAGTRPRSSGGTGIRVNTVQPGIVDDELMAPITAGGPLLDDYLAEMPISRLGTVEDIAAAVRFLAGPESAWISGENLAVDGGHHLRRGANYGLLFGE